HANSSSSRHFYFCFHFFAPSFCTAEFRLSPIQLRRQTFLRSQPHVLFLRRRHGHLRQRLNLRRNFRHQCRHVLRHRQLHQNSHPHRTHAPGPIRQTQSR